MPISSIKGKNITTDWFENQKDIKTIVDLGPGSGTYPNLLGKDKYAWKAVEVWGPYIEHFKLDELYSEIRIGDVQYMDLPDGDCAILGDVLEHIEKEGAIKTFHKVDKQFKHVVISIPVESKSQYVYMGNELERHISVWTREELEKLIPASYTVREFVDPLCVFIK